MCIIKRKSLNLREWRRKIAEDLKVAEAALFSQPAMHRLRI